MYSLSLKEFTRLSKKGNLIPISREIPGDLETPVSAFLKLSAAGQYSCLLESVEGQEKIARFSFIGLAPRNILKFNKGKFEILERLSNKIPRVSRAVKTNDPFKEIQRFMSQYKLSTNEDSLRFCAGLVGYIGYDVVRFFEDIPDKNQGGNLGFPDSLFMFNTVMLVFDHYTHKLKVIYSAFLKDKKAKTIHNAYNSSMRKIDNVIRLLKKPLKEAQRTNKISPEIKYAANKAGYMAMVKKAKEYIRKGDIIQVVISQRISAKIQKRPFDIYRGLRGLNPSPYMFYLKFRDLYLIGSSPEMLVRCENKTATTRPIAGTRPRGKSEDQDLRLENELLNDKKEKAEHLMLVDLGRNDLGRVCGYGSVRVKEFMRVERYSHVMHIVSEIQGRIRPGKNGFDVLRASFPAGTVSGSPKIRAMEIIDELEDLRRGPYAGCVGYISFSGNIDTCITIRTILIEKDIAYIQAGAGIVADSIPEREYAETLNKAKAQLEALK